MTSRSGSSNSVNDSEPVGQRTTHSPQETQSESIHCASGALPMVVSTPRFTKSMAATPTISSQVRTQMPQSTQMFGSNSKNGFDVSAASVRSGRRRRRSFASSTPTKRAISLQLAGVALLAVHGAAVVVDEQELDGAASRLLHRVGVGADRRPPRSPACCRPSAGVRPRPPGRGGTRPRASGPGGGTGAG